MSSLPVPKKYRHIVFGTNVLRNHYVYIYYDKHTPFYVGTGTKYRVFDPHSQNTEERIQKCSFFCIKIVYNGLSKKAAHCRERFLIHQLRNHQLTNQRKPTNAQHLR